MAASEILLFIYLQELDASEPRKRKLLIFSGTVFLVRNDVGLREYFTFIFIPSLPQVSSNWNLDN